MKVSTTKLDNCQAVLNIEAEPADMEKARDMAYRRLVSRASIPGFRPGKAPRQVLERHMGKAALEREAINQYLPVAYQQALKEAELEAVAEPDIEVTQADPLIFKAVVPLRPSVQLGDYAGVRVEIETVPVEEEDVAQALERVRQEQAIWEPVERPVARGDLVTLNVQGKVEAEAFLNQKGLQYEVKDDISYPHPGFADQLQGMAKNEAKSFQLPFAPDYPNQEMRGKVAHFQVETLEIKEKKLAPLDDEFARTVNFPNLEALRERVVTNLKAKAEVEARRKLEEAALNAVVDISHLEFPLVLVEREIDNMLREMGGNPQAIPADAEVREQLRPKATERARQSLVLEKLAEAEKIEVSPQDIDSEVERLAAGAQGKAAEVKKFFAAPGARQALRNSLLSRKTLERLVAIATDKVEAVPARDKGEETVA